MKAMKAARAITAKAPEPTTSTPVQLGRGVIPPLSGVGPASPPASAVAVALTAASNSARAVAVPATAASNSAAAVAASIVRVASLDDVVVVTAMSGVPEASPVDIAACVGVCVGNVPIGVFVGVGVRVLVGPAVLVGPPGVGVNVRVGVGVRVGVFVLVGPPIVAVTVAVGVTVLVAVAVGVFVAGGASTWKEPSSVSTGTEVIGGGEAATTLPKDNGDVPGTALGSTLKVTTATVPSGIGVLAPLMS